jgi:hypothetical protein
MPENDDIELLQQLIGHGGEQAFSLVPLALQKVITERQWQDRRDKNGNPFTGFEAFVTHRLWQGLETTIDDLRVYCRKEPMIQKLILEQMDPGSTHVDAGAKGGRGIKASDNITSFRGTSAIYRLKRLKRDRPDLFEQVIGGIMSANAAAIEAGWHKKPIPIDQLRSWWAKANAEERETFSKEISKWNTEHSGN